MTQCSILSGVVGQIGPDLSNFLLGGKFELGLCELVGWECCGLMLSLMFLHPSPRFETNHNLFCLGIL